ncbi:Fatty Acid 2-hydroxylase [Micractinium conductrix]|uniref:Fatty acid 2-hydroxylase n=1 Tax=Micractinium conductrix TaxID=554055 RepID=A0A2P6V0D5_9CHLO|nr:Fatty Acid 2-hydroxylase [Micractinium conductrix]|eukprot:PSC67533.1 Fatty Acid 2-hydroxylase [Micractinium conductrix]
MAKGARKGAAADSAAAPRVFTRQQVADLAAEGKHVYMFKGGVYDVDPAELMHPGGRQVLEDHRGEDITELFQGGGADGHAHSKGANALLENYCVGRLEGHEAPERADLASLVDESKALLPQVVKLDPQTYIDWVAAPSTGHPVMFPNPLIERMTCTEWYVVPLLWLPIAAYYMWGRGVVAGGLPPILLPVNLVIGVLIWQLIEYSIHRGLFHFDPKTPKGIEWHFMLHGHHHKYPMDFDRLVFPPPIAALVIGMFHALLHALMPLAWASSLLGGGIVGYVLYDTTHWALHSGRAEWLFTHVLKSSHMDHHYVDETVGYGISSTLYDHLFGSFSAHLAKKLR